MPKIKSLAIAVLLSVGLGACATIGPEHEALSRQIQKGIDRQEMQYMALVDSFEGNALTAIDERMQFIEGPVLIKNAVEISGFDKKVCQERGKLDQAHELLQFVHAASKAFEKRKAKYMKSLRELTGELRSKGRGEYQLQRQAASALTHGLKQYTKEKKWREDMLREMGAPVDKVSEINEAAKKFHEDMEAVND